MSTTDSIEVTASTVEQATNEALEQLGVSADEAAVEVLATPRAGVLGLGARQARVRATRKSAPASSADERPPTEAARANPQPRENRRAARESGDREGDDAGGVASARKSADLAEQSREATVILKQILELMGERGEVRQVEVDPESVELEFKGDGSGVLIGRHGQTLDALEYIVNRILARRIKDAAPISLETESYRERRRQQLHRMALSMGERAKREHATVRLDPMPPRDRRAVHLALKDDPMITTRSAGDGFMRSIEIVPVEGRRRERGDAPQQQQGQRGRGGRRRERGNEPRGNQQRANQQPQERETRAIEPRESEALGEQGGFKHGQKRIV
ncbi:MAG TPA: RNA-binding cell elongation regulator Jag/EloR [Candidatus Acidoferrales bacterium]|nr:RNA-binding cell elongation regulator Jag/EloR [Candidatus Acidoferrales bacterium]